MYAILQPEKEWEVEVVCLINLRQGGCHSDYKYLVVVIAKDILYEAEMILKRINTIAT